MCVNQKFSLKLDNIKLLFSYLHVLIIDLYFLKLINVDEIFPKNNPLSSSAQINCHFEIIVCIHCIQLTSGNILLLADQGRFRKAESISLNF